MVSKMTRPAVFRIISGGQTGVDQAALDVSRLLGIPHGGFVPAGRWTTDHALPSDYIGMEEIAAGRSGDATGLRVRTRMNAETADITLVLEHSGAVRDEGTEYTVACVCDKAERAGQEADSYLVIADLARMQQRTAREKVRAALDAALGEVARKESRRFATTVPVVTLNVAGPRQPMPGEPDVYGAAQELLLELLEPERRAFHVAPQDRAATIEQGFESLRHWDTIRWLAPFFFFTLVGGALLGLGNVSGGTGFRIASAGLVLLGYLALLLIWKTIHYHIKQVQVLVQLGLDRKGLPMLGFNWVWTATTQFSLAIVVTMALLTVAGVAGRETTTTFLGIDPQSETDRTGGGD